MNSRVSDFLSLSVIFVVLSLSKKMLTAKLVISKFEDGGKFKSLYVTIPEEDNSLNVKFSKWIEGNDQLKKESDKSSRLVVKIVSGKETNKIELDSCAKEISDANSYLATLSNDSKSAISIDHTFKISLSKSEGGSVNGESFTPHERPSMNRFENNAQSPIHSFTNMDFSNPLEHSLQKVKENNARIMENIHLLNRTLTYTKKKEILDIICPKSMRTYSCNACGKCFVYETGLKRHYSMRHAMHGVQSRWQIVWTCVQCFQVWPQQEHAIQHSKVCCLITLPASSEYVREIKTSLLLQCEFCEKVYTSIPRLLRHSKMHTTLNNYECNPCGQVFKSYKMVEQHWNMCQWQKTHYSFTLPKMLLCNACDRKFRNYEQLYNHRYKVGHFMTKTRSSTEEDMQPLQGQLVYQCELCNQWFSTVSEIMSHRSQHHSFNYNRPVMDKPSWEGSIENY